MSRSSLLRTRRALRFNTLDALEARALLTASPGLVATSQVIPPTVVVASPVPITTIITSASSASAIPTVAATSNFGGASSISATVPSSGSSPAAANSTGSGSNLGGSDPTSGSSGTSDGDPSTSGDGTGGQPKNPSLDPAGDALIAAAKIVNDNLGNAQAAAEKGKSDVTRDQEALDDANKRILGITADQQTLAEQIKIAATDSTANGQMVFAYLKNEELILQKEMEWANSSLQAAQAALDADLQRFNDANATVLFCEAQLAAMRQAWLQTHFYGPPF